MRKSAPAPVLFYLLIRKQIKIKSKSRPVHCFGLVHLFAAQEELDVRVRRAAGVPGGLELDSLILV